MAVPIFGMAKAVQMVAAGLDRDELKSTILGRLIETGAVSTDEEAQQVWQLGQTAASASYLLSAGDTAGANAALAQLASMGGGDLVVTAKVQVLPPEGQPLAPPFVNQLGEEEAVWRTIQIRVGAGSGADAITAAAQGVIAELAGDKYRGLFGEQATYGAPQFYAAVRLP